MTDYRTLATEALALADANAYELRRTIPGHHALALTEFAREHTATLARRVIELEDAVAKEREDIARAAERLAAIANGQYPGLSAEEHLVEFADAIRARGTTETKTEKEPE